MVGDTTYDIDLAKAVGVRTVGVELGCAFNRTTSGKGSYVFAHDFEELEGTYFLLGSKNSNLIISQSIHYIF